MILVLKNFTKECWKRCIVDLIRLISFDLSYEKWAKVVTTAMYLMNTFDSVFDEEYVRLTSSFFCTFFSCFFLHSYFFSSHYSLLTSYRFVFLFQKLLHPQRDRKSNNNQVFLVLFLVQSCSLQIFMTNSFFSFLTRLKFSNLFPTYLTTVTSF